MMQLKYVPRQYYSEWCLQSIAEPGILMRGTASEVLGMESDTWLRNTVNERRTVTSETEDRYQIDSPTHKTSRLSNFFHKSLGRLLSSVKMSLRYFVLVKENKLC